MSFHEKHPQRKIQAGIIPPGKIYGREFVFSRVNPIGIDQQRYEILNFQENPSAVLIFLRQGETRYILKIPHPFLQDSHESYGDWKDQSVRREALPRGLRKNGRNSGLYKSVSRVAELSWDPQSKSGYIILDEHVTDPESPIEAYFQDPLAEYGTLMEKRKKTKTLRRVLEASASNTTLRKYTNAAVEKIVDMHLRPILPARADSRYGPDDWSDPMIRVEQNIALIRHIIDINTKTRIFPQDELIGVLQRVESAVLGYYSNQNNFDYIKELMERIGDEHADLHPSNILLESVRTGGVKVHPIDSIDFNAVYSNTARLTDFAMYAASEYIDVLNMRHTDQSITRYLTETDQDSILARKFLEASMLDKMLARIIRDKERFAIQRGSYEFGERILNFLRRGVYNLQSDAPYAFTTLLNNDQIKALPPVITQLSQH